MYCLDVTDLMKVSALREIRYYQKQVGLIFIHNSFNRLVKQICHEQHFIIQWRSSALTALQYASETALCMHFEMLYIHCWLTLMFSNHATCYGKHITILKRDASHIQTIMRIWDRNCFLAVKLCHSSDRTHKSFILNHRPSVLHMINNLPRISLMATPITFMKY